MKINITIEQADNGYILSAKYPNKEYDDELRVIEYKERSSATASLERIIGEHLAADIDTMMDAQAVNLVELEITITPVAEG